jgi:hypothetical protein
MKLVEAKASIERLARAVLESALPGRVSTGGVDSERLPLQASVPKVVAGVLARHERRDLTGLAAGRGPRAPCLAVLAAQWRIHRRTVEVGTLLRSWCWSWPCRLRK